MTIAKRTLRMPAEAATRLWGEVSTRAGRRRMRRRATSRFLVVAVAVTWTVPFMMPFWNDQIDYFVNGRVVVSGQEQTPHLNTAVVLVPAPDEDDVHRLERYARIDPGGTIPEAEEPEDAAVWLWTDVDGWFGAMHVSVAAPYRIEVRRGNCPPVDLGVHRFDSWNFWARRLELEIPACEVTS